MSLVKLHIIVRALVENPGSDDSPAAASLTLWKLSMGAAVLTQTWKMKRAVAVKPRMKPMRKAFLLLLLPAAGWDEFGWV